MRRLIVNADDLGLAPEIDRGIVRAFREGIVTSATMLVNLEHFESAVATARANPDLPLGIHLSLLRGRPVSDPAAVPSLVDRRGLLPGGAAALAARCFGGRLALEHVQIELRSQVRRFLDAGLAPTHVDTHKHIHCLPGVMRALGAVLAEFGIDRVRLPVERGQGGAARGMARASWKARGKRALIRAMCRGHRDILERCGLRTTDAFLGFAYMERPGVEHLRELLRGLRPGVTELMCHPGCRDEPPGRRPARPPYRERELAALCDAATRAEIDASGIELVGYRSL